MKHIVSVSLGSSKRNHALETEFMGETCKIERIGTDGNWDAAIKMISDLDGQVDAFGMGGITIFIYAGTRRYVMRDANKLLKAAQKTPIVDGGGIKNILERQSIEKVAQEGIVEFKNKKALMVCAMDRPGMASALIEMGCDTVIGDLIYSLGVPIPMRSLRSLDYLARVVAPIVVKLPFDMLYPTGKKQDVIIPKHSKYYYDADIIAGDFLYIKRYLPQHLEGKTIITNTTTREDQQLLKERGVKLLVTTTPEMNGRSFGTNVMEALLVTMIGKPVNHITEEDYRHWLGQVDFQPGVIRLN